MLRVALPENNSNHGGYVNKHAFLQVVQLPDPEVATQVGLAGLGKDQQIAVDGSADEEGDESQHRDQRRQAAEQQPDDHGLGEPSAAAPETVPILVLGLCQLPSALLFAHGAEGEKLEEVEVPRQIHDMRTPVENHEVHVEVRRVRKCVGQQDSELQRMPHQSLSGVCQRGANARHEDLKDCQEPEVRRLELVLGPSFSAQAEEISEDHHEERRQEHHEEPQRRHCAQRTDERLQSGHLQQQAVEKGKVPCQSVHICELGRGHHKGDEADVEPDNAGISNHLPGAAFARIFHQVGVYDVSRIRRKVDDKLVLVVGDVDHQGQLLITPRCECDKASA
mmetsp:Transcript_47289/g.141156  ORF Transcript_47289/g.141156 Transcript_47289/m.141156 type:complete len:336 (-) Transcript_47289:871-1878(-)